MGKVTEQKEITKVVQVVSYHTCDICGKRSEGDKFPKDWFSFSHSHSDWGNDSFESLETFDVCSAQCYAQQLMKSIEVFYKNGHVKTGKINEMSIEFTKKLLDFMQFPPFGA